MIKCDRPDCPEKAAYILVQSTLELEHGEVLGSYSVKLCAVHSREFALNILDVV